MRLFEIVFEFAHQRVITNCRGNFIPFLSYRVAKDPKASISPCFRQSKATIKFEPCFILRYINDRLTIHINVSMIQFVDKAEAEMLDTAENTVRPLAFVKGYAIEKVPLDLAQFLLKANVLAEIHQNCRVFNRTGQVRIPCFA